MEKSKLKYNYELMKNKIRLEKELSMVKDEIKSSQKECKHLGVIVHKASYVDETYCIKCGIRLSNKSLAKKLNATNYKEDIYNNFYKAERLNKLRDIQSLAISCLEEDENIDDEEFIKKLQLKIDENK